MMRKIFILSLLIIFGYASLAFCAAVESTAVTGRHAQVAGAGIESVVAVADGSSGYVADVDVRGSLSTREYPKQVASSTGGTLLNGTALVSGACYVYSITISGPGTAAGDYVLIYDAASATGTPKFEASVGTAKDTNDISIPGGAIFSTGVFADANSTMVHCAVVYDN